MPYANFEVDPRLATLLSETYRSTEQAIKELVDNAWDADATCVRVRLPEAMTSDPVRVEDDGTGMTEPELRQEYLRVARDRRVVKGERTEKLKRLVKGRKGIGKFAGLMVAEVMEIETRARGQSTRLTIPRTELATAATDLERVSLPLDCSECDPAEHGTTVALRELSQNLSFPSTERLKQLLVFEYGREDAFDIYVNDEPVGLQDVPGETLTEDTNLPEAGPVHLVFKITDEKQPARQAGIVVRVGGKIIGRPSHFGLEAADDVPRPLLRRVYGEVEADGLGSDVTADWGAIIENSKGFAEVQEFARSAVKRQLESTFHREMNLARARLQKDINRRLELLPEYRRRFAETALQRIMQRFYGEPDDRVQPIVSVVLDALERDEYRAIIEKIHEASRGDVASLAEALSEFGVLELSLIAQQAHRRLDFLGVMEELITNADTTEAVVHRALENSLWVFGSEFALMASNETLATVMKRYADEKFAGPRAQKRPDLLLLTQFGQRYTVIEFKRPNHTITRRDVNQAESYRDDLISRFQPIDIALVGKDRDTRIDLNPPAAVKILSYVGLISRARAELSWMLKELTSPPPEQNRAS